MPKQMQVLEDTYSLHRYDLADNKENFLLEAGKQCIGVIASGHFPLDQNFIQHIPNAKIVACSSVGYDAIDVSALTDNGIRFTNTPDVLTDDVADMAILLMLAARRRLLFGDRYVRSGDWGQEGMMPLTIRTQGSRVGILGLGRIGQAIANRCSVMGQQIAYHGRNQKKGVDYSYFEDLVKLAEWSDVLIAATPGGLETQKLVSKQVLEAIGPNGTFINISRGSVVDEAALIELLQSRDLGSAGLDVYENEPNPNIAIGQLDNVVLYPHHASGTQETREAMAQLVVDNLAAYFADRPLLTPVN